MDNRTALGIEGFVLPQRLRLSPKPYLAPLWQEYDGPQARKPESSWVDVANDVCVRRT